MSMQPTVSDRDAFEHLMNEVFRRDNTTLLYRGLVEVGFDDFPSIASMDDATINALRDSKKKVLPADVNIVKLFIQFI